MKIPEILWIIFLSGLAVLGLDMLTNSLDTHNNAWDFLYYIALAKDGFNAVPLASPFVYRYLTPFIVHGMALFGLTIEQGFGLIAYFGAIAQLGSIYFFVYWLSHSRKASYLATAVTALSLYNVKFLLFDIYRPDHLAYALIILQTYLAFRRRFGPLLLVTLVASQGREFNIIPLIAYLFMIMREENSILFIKKLVISVIFLLIAVFLPRILIPVTENYQLVELSKDGFVNLLILPFVPAVVVNFIFVIIAYLVPLLFIAGPGRIWAAFLKLPGDQQRYLAAYTILVLFLSFYGGTDFFRFATFLFLPQIILMGEIAPKISNTIIGFMLTSVIIFNRIWMHFPDWDVEKYRDFYGGFSLRLNVFTFYRILECSLFLLLGRVVQRRQDKVGISWVH